MGIYSQAAGGFEPYKLFNIWYDGDNVTQSSSKISALSDLGIDGNNATQGTAADQPGYTASNASFNGLPTINPSASSGGDIMSLNSSFSINVNSTWTLAFVGKMTGTYWSMWESASTSGAYLWEQLTDTRSYFRDGTNIAFVPSLSFSTENIWIYWCDGTNIYCHNGSDGSTNSVSAGSVTSSITVDAIFRRSTAAVKGEGEMAASAINYGNHLSTTNKNLVGNWLSAKYNLPFTDI